MAKSVYDRIEEIHTEMGNDLFTPCDLLRYELVISNGREYVIVIEKSWNGECYTGYYCIDGEPLDESVDVAEVLLETDEDEYEFVGYAVNERRTIVYEMGA